MLKITVVSITYRTLNNIAPMLHALIEGGAQCEVIWAPTSQRIDSQTPREFGFAVAGDFTGLTPKDAAGQIRFASWCRDHLESRQPDLVLSDDMTTWPNHVIYGLVRRMSARPWHLAWQHGLYQPWYQMREQFDADFFLCYGRLHAFLMGEALASRVLPVGLPKLDQLDVADGREDGGYLSWFAQPLPEAEVQIKLLADVARVTKLPVRIRPHPAAPLAFAECGDLSADNLTIDDPADDPIATLRRCRGFLSTHSSATIEALLLGKSAVLFPSFGLTSFTGYPNVASDFTARAYQAAVNRIASRQNATESFLIDCVGGRRRDHTQRALRVVQSIANQRRTGLDIENFGPAQAALLRASS